MAIRKNVSSLTGSRLVTLCALLGEYINKPTDNPVAEHKAAGMDMSLMIHDMGFLTWHQHFLAKLGNWLVLNRGEKFVPRSCCLGSRVRTDVVSGSDRTCFTEPRTGRYRQFPLPPHLLVSRGYDNRNLVAKNADGHVSGDIQQIAVGLGKEKLKRARCEQLVEGR